MKKIAKFENQNNICTDIEIMVLEKKITYMDAALLYAEEKQLEIEYISAILAKNIIIRSRIQEEAEDLNYLKKRPRLNF